MKALRTCSFKPLQRWSWIGLSAVFAALPMKAWAQSPKPQTAPVFRLHLFSEPSQLEAYKQKNSNAGYLLTQTHWSYLRFQEGQLLPSLAESCKWKEKSKLPWKVECQIRKGLKYSTGEPIEMSDWLRPLELMLDPKDPAPKADLLFPILNAEAVFTGKLPLSKLGVKISGQNISFEIEKPYSDFLYHLTAAHLAPRPKNWNPNVTAQNISLSPVTGPYMFDFYKASDRIALKPNPHFFDGNSKLRSNVEFLFVSEDAVALNLFEVGSLSFNRRLATMNIPKYREKKEFHEVPFLRMDYVGLRPGLSKEVRKLLAESLKYSELQTLFHAPPRPGCPGIPAEWYNGPFCHEFTFGGRGARGSVEPNKEVKEKVKSELKPFRILYSKQGGDDHRRAMEWLQSQWNQNLGVLLPTQQMENNLFQEEIKRNSTNIFRKGVSLDRPTCLAAVEVFHSKSAENFLGLKEPDLDALIEKQALEVDESRRKILCEKSLRLLMDNHWIIPTGPMYFSILADPRWTGWKLNPLNELDLSDLRYQLPFLKVPASFSINGASPLR